MRSFMAARSPLLCRVLRTQLFLMFSAHAPSTAPRSEDFQVEYYFVIFWVNARSACSWVSVLMTAVILVPPIRPHPSSVAKASGEVG